MNDVRRWGLGCCAVSALLLATQTASAQEAGTGIEVGGRLGWGIPLGEAVDGPEGDLDNVIEGQFVDWIDLGYRVTPNVLLGMFGTFGFGVPGDDLDELCDDSLLGSDFECTARNFRVGAQLHYHIAPLSPPDPWLGFGFGYEWLRLGIDGPGADVTLTYRGFEFINLQAGLDFKPKPHLIIGPFATFSLGKYTDISSDCSGSRCGQVSSSEGIDDKALHEWLFLGLRIAYGPG